MRDPRRFFGLRAAAWFCLALPVALTIAPAAAQVPAQQHAPASVAAPPQEPSAAVSDPQQDLHAGAALTRQGDLQRAIPHLLAAQHAGLDPYAVGVNLGICYLGTLQYKQAIAILLPLRDSSARAVTVNNLLAQAYLGDGQPRLAYQAFLDAAAAAPGDESLYAYMADASTDHQNYALGLQVVDRGLRNLPNSARLHYERAVFLARLGRFEECKPEFDRAAQLAPQNYIGFLALVQKDLYEDDFPAADKVLHQALLAGQRDYRLLSLLGTVLLHEGAAPGQPQFAEAQSALEESARERPDYSATQIALGKIYLMENRPRDAIDHLEMGRHLEPNNASVYANLASAWEQLGDPTKARAMRAQVGRILAEKKTAPAPPQP
ncbi:MAG TPA: tetratricopeptide repeat protein [Acidobacteriaceae bacterium]|nr:tetratricopeptide repeat protein [Acidobacteriaceae bacterium]